jgi:putative spermidine/putrescine transport system substrate-binding protein/spermidine/putrescine transport system substrate-binding protein
LLAGCGGGSSASSSGSASATASASTGNPKACKALRLYTWEGEAPPTLLKPFEKKYGVPVTVAYITSAAESMAKLAAGGVKQYDLVFDGSELTKPMKEAGVIKPIDTTKFSEYGKLLKFATEPFLVGSQPYALAVDWGVNPFIYSTNALKTPPTSWAALWDPKLKGQVSLWEDISMIWIGASVLGFDKNPEQLFNLSKAQLAQIRDKMLQLKGNVRTVWKSGGDLIQLYANHEVGASMGWSYILNELQAKHQPVAEAKLADMGAQGWTEGASLLSNISPDCEAAAYAFLAEMLTPQGQAALALSSGYTPVNPEAAKYMSKDLIKKTGIADPKGFLGSAIFKRAVNDPEAYNQTMQEIIAGVG